RKAANWNPLEPGDPPSDLRSFYAELTKSSGEHGGPFNYVSPNTDLLGWVIERAAGRRYADLMSELIWRPMGAGRSAYIPADRLAPGRPARPAALRGRPLRHRSRSRASRSAHGRRRAQRRRRDRPVALAR